MFGESNDSICHVRFAAHDLRTVFPVMLNAAREVVKTGLPVIVDGGVVEQSQADALLTLGVLAVGLGATLWGIKQL